MKKKGISLYYIILLLILQVLVVFTGVSVRAEEPNIEMTETQKNAIVDHCDTIKEDLRKVQREDSRARVYLGRYYETILSKFIMPLNLRLVENNISNAGLIQNQTDMATRRTKFVNDFISYQQNLEELVNTDCKAEPGRFYEKLTATKEKRAKVNSDTEKMRALIDEQVKLVSELKGQL